MIRNKKEKKWIYSFCKIVLLPKIFNFAFNHAELSHVNNHRSLIILILLSPESTISAKWINTIMTIIRTNNPHPKIVCFHDGAPDSYTKFYMIV